MESNALLSLYFERSNTLQNYWSFYVSVVLALIAFFGGSKPESRNKGLAGIMTIAFLMVSAVNLSALLDVTEQRLLLKSLVNAAPPKADVQTGKLAVGGLVDLLRPLSYPEVLLTHLAGDVLVVGAIWYLTLSKPPKKRAGA